MRIVVVQSVIAAVVALYVVVRSLWLLLLLEQDARKGEFLSSLRGFASEGVGRRGVSLLCRDNGDIERLQSLLSVEYPDYEVVMTADSLRNAESLQRIIARYRMVAVDGQGVVGDYSSVRRLYRSASRCYRRLILLDVSTTGQIEDFDAACEIATYDYLLPLWGDEVLLPGAVERLVAEVSLGQGSAREPVAACVGSFVALYPRSALGEGEGFGGVAPGCRGGCRLIYEPLAAGGALRGAKIWFLAGGIGVVAIASIVSLTLRFSVIIASALLLAIGVLLLVAYIAHRIVIREASRSVGYGEILYLFFENLLSRIWKIRK